MLDATHVILNLAGAVAVTAYVNPIFLVPIALMSLAFIFIRRAFLKTSRSIKFLEASGRLALGASIKMLILFSNPLKTKFAPNSKVARFHSPSRHAEWAIDHSRLQR